MDGPVASGSSRSSASSGPDYQYRDANGTRITNLNASTSAAPNLSTREGTVGAQQMQTDFLKSVFSDGDKGPPTPPGIRIAVEKLSAAMEEANWVKADQYRSAIRELNDDLWQHLVAIGSAAAKTESFAHFYINANIAEIAKQELWLYELLKNRPMTPESEDRESAQRAWLTANFAEELLRHLKWIVGGTYWRIFDALNPPIQTNLIWEFFQTLSFIGILALDAGAPTLAESAIDELKTMAIGCLEKPPGSFRSAAEIAVFIARIGIVARQIGDQQILNASLVSLREVDRHIFAKQEEMQPDADTYDAAVLNELRSLKEQLDRDNLFLDEEDAAFFIRVTTQDIDAFTVSSAKTFDGSRSALFQPIFMM